MEPTNSVWVHSFEEEPTLKVCQRIVATAEKDPLEPIVIYIDSYGGAVYGLGAILSTMDSVPNPIITVALGKAMSAGAMLLSHGDIRFVGPHAKVMVHELSSGFWGNVRDMENENRHAQELNDYWMDVLAKNCGKSLKQLGLLFDKNREIYLDAKGSLEFGIADHIGIPVIEKTMVFEAKTAYGHKRVVKRSKK